MGQHPAWSEHFFAAGLVKLSIRAVQYGEEGGDNVLSMRFMHAELGTPVYPNWVKLRRE